MSNLTKTVKFCGFSDAEQLAYAATLGIHAVGLVFYPSSPRAVTIEQAQQLIKHVPALVTVVALVVNMPADQLQALADAVRFDVIQFHGDESPSDCHQLATQVGKRWMKALRIDANFDDAGTIRRRIQAYADAGACSIILDAYHPDKFGGTGERFDWSLIPSDSPIPMILAGGLTVDNVAKTLDLPIAGVDVSGGIEVVKGQKDKQKMRAFMAVLRG